MTTIIFDVLIVYSEKFADSADSLATVPFGPRSENELCNEVYGYLLEACAQQGLQTAFTSSSDIIGAGLCKSYWLMKEGTWTKVNQPGYAKLIFDKLSPTTEKLTHQRDLLFSSSSIKPFNNPELHKIFLDKYTTYTTLPNLAIPTVALTENTMRGLTEALVALDQLLEIHPHAPDFSTDIIIKERFGSQGIGIYKFQRNQIAEILSLFKENLSQLFIIQPFTKFDQGFNLHGQLVSADIRLVYLGGKIVQTYVRVAQEGSFLSNSHQGGSLAHLTADELPAQILTKAEEILELLNKSSSLFSLDFMISNNGNAYLIEGNTGPGLDWNPLSPSDVKGSKEFIEMLAKELLRRVKL